MNVVINLIKVDYNLHVVSVNRVIKAIEVNIMFIRVINHNNQTFIIKPYFYHNLIPFVYNYQFIK